MSEGNPIFVFSYPRAGSTLLMRLLQRCRFNEKEISFSGEFTGFGDLMGTIRHILKNQDNSIKDTNEKFLPHFSYLSKDSAHEVASHIVQAVCNPRKTEVWGFKEVNFGVNGWESFKRNVIDPLHRVFPNARFVFNLRDKGEVLSSIAKSGWWGPGDYSLKLARQEEAYREAARFTGGIVWDYEDTITDFMRLASMLGVSISGHDLSETLSKVLK